MKKHFFFDLDGTLTESRQEIALAMAATLAVLKNVGIDIIVISGAERSRMEKQLAGVEVRFIMAQSGADSPFWQTKMNERDEVEVWRHIKKVQKLLYEHDWGDDEKSWNRYVENRGGQISFSLTGHNCPIEIKQNYDPSGKRRTVILKEVPFHSLKLECRIAGTTCFDYTFKNATKGKNIARLINHLKWNKEDCIYFGDKLMKGGNDETVMGVIDTVQVSGPNQLMQELKKYV